MEATESVFCWGTRDKGRTSIVPAWCSKPTRRTRPGEKALRRVPAADRSTASRTANFPALLIGGTSRREKLGRIVWKQDTNHQGRGTTTQGARDEPSSTLRLRMRPTHVAANTVPTMATMRYLRDRTRARELATNDPSQVLPCQAGDGC